MNDENKRKFAMVMAGYCPEGHGRLRVIDLPKGLTGPDGGKQAGWCDVCAAAYQGSKTSRDRAEAWSNE